MVNENQYTDDNYYVEINKNKQKILFNRLSKLFNISWIFIAIFLIGGVVLGVCYESIHCAFSFMYIFILIVLSSLFLLSINCALIFFTNYKLKKEEKLNNS